jgi:branched-subunit amino acid transport protein AzlD
MGAVIFFCRAFPFLFFQNKPPADGDGKGEKRTDEKHAAQTGFRRLFTFVEKIVPPVAMTVLAFNSLGSAMREDPRQGLPILAAATFTALVHLWKRNSLLSIFGGTAVFMALKRLL